MSHACTSIRRNVVSLLTKVPSYGRTHTANAATASKKRSVCEPVGMAHCVRPEMDACTSIRRNVVSLQVRRQSRLPVKRTIEEAEKQEIKKVYEKE